MAPGPGSWPCCWAWGLRRCSAGGASSLVTVMALTAARGTTATSPIASTKKSANGSWSPAISRNSLRCHPDRSCRSWGIEAATSSQSAASTACCTLTARLTGGAGPAATTAQTDHTPARSRADQVWSWDITYLPTTVRGVWLYLYMVIDAWSRKLVAWDVAKREDPAIAADLVSRACLRERISKGRRQPLTLHAAKGNA